MLPARCLRGPPLCAAHREMTKTSLKPAEFGETRNRRIPLGLGPALDHRTEVSCPHLRPRPRDHRCLATPVPFRHLFTPKSLRPRALWRHQLHSSDSANARFVFELRNASYIRRHSSAFTEQTYWRRNAMSIAPPGHSRWGPGVPDPPSEVACVPTTGPRHRRVSGAFPGAFYPGQLRTLQRRVNEWRTKQGQTGHWVLAIPLGQAQSRTAK